MKTLQTRARRQARKFGRQIAAPTDTLTACKTDYRQSKRGRKMLTTLTTTDPASRAVALTHDTNEMLSGATRTNARKFSAQNSAKRA